MARWSRPVLIILPAVSVGLFEWLRHSLLDHLPVATGNLLAAGVALAASVLYYTAIFAAVTRLVHSLERAQAERAVFEERERIAADLHDSIAQTLFFLGVKARTARQKLFAHDEPGADDLAAVEAAAAEALQELRQAIDALKPAEGAGDLTGALRGAVATWQRRTGLDVAVDLTELRVRVAPDAVAAAVRVVREALSNAGKHARASHLAVRLKESGDAVTVEVADDGQGFEVLPPTGTSSLRKKGPARWGLRLMARRARAVGGELSIETTPGRGTLVRLRLPVRAVSSSVGL